MRYAKAYFVDGPAFGTVIPIEGTPLKEYIFPAKQAITLRSFDETKDEYVSIRDIFKHKYVLFSPIPNSNDVIYIYAGAIE